jgi:predicted AAA+ superfamily ATPase
LDFGEFLNFKGVPNRPLENMKSLESFNPHEFERLTAHYEEYIEFGGFPEVVLANSSADKLDILEDIVSSYINIDIRSIADFKDSSAIFNLVKMLAGRIGSRMDYSKLSRLAGLSRQTVQHYIELFERTYLISLVPVHTTNQDREIVKAKKIYFSDTGMLKILTQVSSGSGFENAVFNQLRHQGKLGYYALKNGREIDFIVDGEMAIEVKETPVQTDLKQLADLANLAEVKTRCLVGRHQTPGFSDYTWGGSIL